jgi:hypothetical protein
VHRLPREVVQKETVTAPPKVPTRSNKYRSDECIYVLGNRYFDKSVLCVTCRINKLRIKNVVSLPFVARQFTGLEADFIMTSFEAREFRRLW